MDIAIIGASYLQLPLILKAKELGLTTHVFAWECGDVGEAEADHFYPISIVEKDKILDKCKEIGIDGICSIASDLAVITVCYVAEKMGLVSNSISDSLTSTNKHLMKEALVRSNVPTARFILTGGEDPVDITGLNYPLIVKPTDRSGSRGVSRINGPDDDIASAIARAVDQSFEKKALVEEYIFGKEYSVESISYEGKHTLLTVTEKFTTGDPHYIETGHMEPSGLSEAQLKEVEKVVFAGLDALGVRFGASHSEIKISGDKIFIIEIGARMGGDMIGSTLVRLSTGYDFVKAVIDISLGRQPERYSGLTVKTAAIRYIMDENGLHCLNVIRNDFPEILYEADDSYISKEDVTDSSTRKGYFIISSDDRALIDRFMPERNSDS